MSGESSGIFFFSLPSLSLTDLIARNKSIHKQNFYFMATKKKTNDLREIMRLMRRWVFDLAHVLMNDECMGRSEALRQGYLAGKLLEALGRGEVRFVYEKKDGTLREARGTLCHGISEAFDNYEYKTDLTENDFDTQLTFTYWDLDREAFRTFSAERIKGIIEVKCKEL